VLILSLITAFSDAGIVPDGVNFITILMKRYFNVKKEFTCYIYFYTRFKN
jgi:hypothetical protein